MTKDEAVELGRTDDEANWDNPARLRAYRIRAGHEPPDGTPGADGRYCTHHDDDPAHGRYCYDPGYLTALDAQSKGMAQMDWKRVPVEPTEAMIMAMHDGPLMADDHDLDPDNRKWIESCYRAMIEAAPAVSAMPRSNETTAFQELIDLEQSIIECRTLRDFVTVQKTILAARALPCEV